MYTAQNVREKFTQFFAEKSHEKLDSSSLIPHNDPTLMFANAGMNQFKDNFTGKANPKNKRATTIQKCVRAGGKHNDLENVGLTARHHTFFEMLGNFSFGDYFKNEAIKMAWEFLTVELKIPKDKLYVTVHDSDEEARKIWHEQEGVPLDRIFFMGDKDNFWEMGELGPCGPCSEIFYDHGEQYSDGSDTSKCILADESRYVEIWNLVFMQYNKVKNAKGEIERQALPKPSIDTGAGLERLTACLQNVYWNYDTDLFQPTIKLIEQLSQKKYSDNKYTTSMRIVCDHIRASVMLITDGVMPSNEGRGYVLRRIVRRAIRQFNELGIDDVSFYKLIPSVFDKLGDEYPQNKSNQSLAEKLLKIEEEKFRQTLKTGLDLINKEIKSLNKGDSLKGDIAFKLYDTYGFPLDLTQIILLEKGITLDEAGFDKAMQTQKENSRAASKFSAQENNLEVYYKIKEEKGESLFTGYTKTSQVSKLLAIHNEDTFTALVFDSTPFYPEGGGQAGDTGIITSGTNNIKIEVLDTQKPVDGLIVHICRVEDHTNLSVGAELTLNVDILKRELSMRNHSATHLLQAALIEVLGDHVKQAGSSVNSENLRFDFTHPEALKKEEISKVEKLVNSKIADSLAVTASLMSKDQATKKGAMALFGEKYGDEVRVLEMGDFSLELCGGTHVRNTKDIGLFSITLETSLASGVRRIEGLSSTNAFNYLNNRSQLLSSIERSFAAKSDVLLKKLDSLQSDLKVKSKEIKKLNDQLQAQAAKDMFSNTKTLSNGVGLISVNLKDGNPKEFRSISDKFIDQNKTDILFLYTLDSEKISYILRTDKANKNYNCSNVLKNSQEIVSGRGGGRPDMAQGSGVIGKHDVFIQKVEQLIGEI
jgi:alanyl-tRNA synthetase